MNVFEETRIIFRTERRLFLRSVRTWVLLGIYLLFCVGSLRLFIRAAEGLEEVARSHADLTQRTQAEGAFHSAALALLFEGDASADEMLARLPLGVLLTFRLSLFFLPLYVVLLAFDLVSSELGAGTLRYLTVRARRSALLAGKALSRALILLIALAVLQTGLVAYAFYTYRDGSAWTVLVAMLQLSLGAGVCALWHFSVSLACSTFTRSPFGALVLNIGVLLFLSWLGTQPLLGALMPSSHAARLLHPHAGPFLLSVFVYAAGAAAALSLAFAVFTRSDV